MCCCVESVSCELVQQQCSLVLLYVCRLPSAAAADDDDDDDDCADDAKEIAHCA